MVSLNKSYRRYKNMNNKKWYYFWGVYTTVFCLYLLVIIGYMVMESIRIFSSEPSLERLEGVGFVFLGIPIFIGFLFSFTLITVNYFLRCKKIVWILIFISSLVYIIFSFSAHPIGLLICDMLHVTENPGWLLSYLDVIYLLPLFIMGCYKVFNLIKYYKIKK